MDAVLPLALRSALNVCIRWVAFSSMGEWFQFPWTGNWKAVILSEGLPPVPSKLVSKICRGEFVDTAEMLRDDIEVE